MPLEPSQLSRPRRAFTGFDRERATYESHKAELLKHAEGKFVAIVGDELVGPLESDQEVERTGYARFGPGPLYIKQVLADGPSTTLAHLPLPAYADLASLALRAEALAPSETPQGQRPFVGYDRERSMYARLKPTLLRRAEGKYVVLVGEDLEGPVDTFEDALRAGWNRFGLGPLYVKQVLADEPTAEAIDNRSCRS
jgi:hypothetical protein